MKNITKATVMALALGASAWIITAQDSGVPAQDANRGPQQRRFHGPPPGDFQNDGQEGQGPGPRRPPVPPVIGVLDANHDGTIDATEIANASAALLTLDKNSDGQLTRDELRPPLPPQGEAPGHPRRGPRPPHGDNQQPAPQDN